ncbi:MAG TPA: YkgJ family cysteine cluster protein [Pirellulales bacterium]|nr:YkgJ family cysteine cluster protein [Pirellulales bacterium]
MPRAPWFQDGLRFQCTQCGDCCTGAPGYVWVTEDEIAALAKLLGLAADDFEARYVRCIGTRKSLIEFDNGDCVFFDNQSRKCKVYEARPRQCRTWPFWDSNIRSPQAWQKTCEVCPGSGQGKLYSVEEVLAQSAVIKI